MQFLDWFVKEQGEEEANANDLISKMELFGSNQEPLYAQSGVGCKSLHCAFSGPVSKSFINERPQREPVSSPSSLCGLISWPA